MYQVQLICTGVPESSGAEAAVDITEEFSQHRQWHRNVLCTWDGRHLRLQADNDFDPDGLALMDEFSDCIAAYIEPFTGSLRVESLSTIPVV
ncbi:hypothetical protein [Tahibacter amnicola]|uniref:Uncharacterized protein n=1 Tax=Tahibacter amnicola TaxID=2976241 RepID=A0ABY6BFZ5_9GAMM|nr:hypothetical protein [Tahibacter amnicola]UXI68946.1 hypothetical protein N4264_04625 [Tahibacter amnicola]